MINPNYIGLVYSIPGECDQFLTVLHFTENGLEISGHLNLAHLGDFDVDEAEKNWVLESGELYRVQQWASGKKTACSMLKLALEGDCYRVVNFTKKEKTFGDESK